MKIATIEGMFSACKVADGFQFPNTLMQSKFFAISKKNDEVSVFCETGLVTFPTLQKEDGWGCMYIDGQLDFSLTGILARLATVLAEEKISIIVHSTFDTDVVWVRSDEMKRAKAALAKKGYDIV